METIPMNVRPHGSPHPTPGSASRKRRLRHRRARRMRVQIESRSIPVEPGGMVDVALRELGAVLVRVLPPD